MSTEIVAQTSGLPYRRLPACGRNDLSDALPISKHSRLEIGDTADWKSASRRRVAAERVLKARAALLNCHLCAHHCGVNRVAGEQGLCHAGAGTRVFSAQVEVSDELELIPTFAIALSGCDLRCAFCITGAESWNPRAGENLDLEKLAARAESALTRGARSVMILGGEPTIHLPTALDIVSVLPDDARLVWKTNAHGSTQARALLAGLFDVWLADYKFGNDVCAERLACVPNYSAIVRENLLWAMHDSELIVRHLLMPGHVECCWRPVAAWLANEMSGVKVNVREGFWPGWQASRHAELRRTVSTAEAERAWSIAREFELNLVE
jgi:putative pyruvate formate lyase activating enzyme